MNENAPLQFEKLYVYRRKPPYIGFNHQDALNLQDCLEIQKALNQEPSRQPILLHAREEAGCIMITLGNGYSMHWAAIELNLPGSYQSILDDFVLYKVPPRFKVSLTVPSELNPGFCRQGILNIIKANNRPDLNAVSNWRSVRKGQTHTQQKFHISFDTRSLSQLMKKGFKISLGSVEAQLELIGTGFNGIQYGQSGGFQGNLNKI